MTQFVNPSTLKSWLHDGEEIAVLDVREHGQYGESHLFYGTSLPYSRLEIDVQRLVPRKQVRVVVYDSGEADTADVATRAADRLQALGYLLVWVLEGGTRAWKAAGYQLFAGVNLPSKTFGELVEHAYGTPRMGAAELAARQASGEPLVVLDGRPVSEFYKMNIPGAVCCPNGELAYRVHSLVTDESTPIIINCAGRTRSILGAQTLINLGIPNPVYALENGTQGWYLIDLPLEHGGTQRYTDDSGSGALQAPAQALAQRFKVPSVSADTVAQWAEASRSLFLCDVRTPEEFRAGSLPGAQHTPGGQLVQAGDQYVGVRGARLVLFDSDGVRAAVIASWLRQMGQDASVLTDGIQSDLSLPGVVRSTPPALPLIAAQDLQQRAARGEVAIVDVRPGMTYREAHIPGSLWSIRPRLALALQGDARPVVLVSDEAEAETEAAQWTAMELAGEVLLLDGGLAAWQQAGLPLQVSPEIPSNEECIDYLFFVHDRHDGNKEAARQYLAWETGLVAQLDAQERAAFHLPPTTAHSSAD